MYHKITNEDPYQVPMRIYPAPHYTMGGLWVDYNLQSNIPGLFVLGEANFSDHGANRLGASALMQGLADGYFIAPYSIPTFLAQSKSKIPENHPAFEEALQNAKDMERRLVGIGGKRSPDSFHRQLGRILWDKCGMARNAKGLEEGISEIRNLREEFWKDLRVLGNTQGFNPELEQAGRVADFLEFGELLCRDALHRKESCGGHFREEYQTPENEAKRDDENFCYVAAWENPGPGKDPVLHKEALNFTKVPLTQRSYQ
jgi:succinate dehydrogenase / fumarate reductase flavoprotein subunit